MDKNGNKKERSEIDETFDRLSITIQNGISRLVGPILSRKQKTKRNKGDIR